MILSIEETFIVGNESFFDSVSVNDCFGVVFEDDGETGYFYAVDMKNNESVLDALHIYNVENVIDKEIPSKIQIAWTEDGMIASLLINSYCHAIFDFKNRGGYCRNGFPDSKRNWTQIKERLLTDELIDNLFKQS